MNFYITDCNVVDNTFYITAEFKCLPLEKQQFKQEVFHWPDEGCKSPHCNLSANFHPTTYEFLHVISENCGLGFSATQKCRSIKDDRYRILKKQKYKDLAQEHAACGGLDEWHGGEPTNPCRHPGTGQQGGDTESETNPRHGLLLRLESYENNRTV